MNLLPIKYAIFAVISMGVNQLTQYPIDHALRDWIGKDLALLMSMGCGTLTGLIVKYILDKRWIFYYIPTSKRDDLSRFGLYSMLGLVTTAIFFASELSFFYVFNSETAKFVGATIGLTIGYIIKYMLDKKYVFNTAKVNV